VPGTQRTRARFRVADIRALEDRLLSTLSSTERRTLEMALRRLIGEPIQTLSARE